MDSNTIYDLDRFPKVISNNIFDSINLFNTNNAVINELNNAIACAHHSFLFIPPSDIIGPRDTGLGLITTNALTSLRSSYFLAVSGFYSSAFHNLRQILEMSNACSYYSLYELGSGEIEDWVNGLKQSPPFTISLRKILKLRKVYIERILKN